MGALSFFFMFAGSPSYSLSMLLNVSNAFVCIPGVLGFHGFIVFMVSFVLFVSTLVALTDDVDLTNAKEVPTEMKGQRNTEKEKGRGRGRDIARIDTEGIRTPAGRAQRISSPSP